MKKECNRGSKRLNVFYKFSDIPKYVISITLSITLFYKQHHQKNRKLLRVRERISRASEFFAQFPQLVRDTSRIRRVRVRHRIGRVLLRFEQDGARLILVAPNAVRQRGKDGRRGTLERRLEKVNTKRGVQLSQPPRHSGTTNNVRRNRARIDSQGNNVALAFSQSTRQFLHKVDVGQLRVAITTKLAVVLRRVQVVEVNRS